MAGLNVSEKHMKLLTSLLISTVLQAAADPSLVPLQNPTDGAPRKYSERSRILTDLDGDKVDDMLLSGGSYEFGTMGGPWAVYLNRDGDFVRVGEIWAHPLAIAIEPDQARIHKDAKTRRYARIWVYLKSSGRIGAFGYYRVGEDTIDEMKSIEIYPGDGGTALGNAIYEATFKHSPIPFTIEHSTTDDAGKVSWSKTKR